jgi:hypothetical protein
LYVVLCCAILIILFIPCKLLAYGDPLTPEVFLKGSKPYGTAYEDWMIKWWQWDMSIPKEQHPKANPNLTKCPVGESGPVSFLTQSLQGESHYACTIPAGHAILLSISTGECTTDDAHSNSLADLIKCATEGDKYLTFEATVDGVRLNGLGPDQNYAISRLFNMTVPKDNAYDLQNPGTFKAVTGGYFLFLKPLPTGEHSVNIAAKVINPIDPSYNFNYHAIFALKVE